MEFTHIDVDTDTDQAPATARFYKHLDGEVRLLFEWDISAASIGDTDINLDAAEGTIRFEPGRGASVGLRNAMGDDRPFLRVKPADRGPDATIGLEEI